MNLTTLFGKLQEHEIKLNRFPESKESEKKKNGLALKAEEVKEIESDDDTIILVYKFKNFMRHEKNLKMFNIKMKKDHHLFQHASNAKRKVI